MAKVMSKRENFANRLRESLREGLSLAGLPVQKIEIEAIPGTKLHRVTVASKRFAKLRPSERQDIVWRIVSAAFTPDEQLRISSILHDGAWGVNPPSWRES